METGNKYPNHIFLVFYYNEYLHFLKTVGYELYQNLPSIIIIIHSLAEVF
jgi:hypothetical protein